MRPTAVFFGYLFCCLVLAAAATVPLVQTGWLDYPPERILGRLAQVFVLLGLWPLLKTLGLASREALGLGASRRILVATAVRGWLLGIGILLALVAALTLLEVRIPDPGAPAWGSLVPKILQALLGGLLIGLFEEAFFRGALYSAIRRRGGIASAALWSALLYAVLHLMKPGALAAGVAFDWSGALDMVGGVLIEPFHWRHLDTLVALTLVGIFLALVRERTGHIGWCIGLHAGWVLVIQVTRRLTDDNPESPFGFLAGDYDGTVGWLSAVWIGLLALGYWRLGAARPGADVRE